MESAERAQSALRCGVGVRVRAERVESLRWASRGAAPREFANRDAALAREVPADGDVARVRGLGVDARACSPVNDTASE